MIYINTFTFLRKYDILYLRKDRQVNFPQLSKYEVYYLNSLRKDDIYAVLNTAQTSCFLMKKIGKDDIYTISLAEIWCLLIYTCLLYTSDAADE